MKLSQGVEWMLHGLAVIAQAPAGVSVSRRVLSDYYGLPDAYLAKHLKSLVRAGLLVATTGPHGGFRLARPATEISALDIIEAIEGSASPFACEEIRLRVPAAPERYRAPCPITRIMDNAHQAWRNELRGVTVHDIVQLTPERVRMRTAAHLAAGRAAQS